MSNPGLGGARHDEHAWTMVRRSGRTVVAFLGLAILSGCTDDPSELPPSEPPRPHPAERRARVAVADGATPDLVVLDMELKEVRAALTLPAVARSVRGSYSGTVGAVVTDAGTAFVSSGVGVIDHTGPEYSSPHIHVYKSKPQILDFSLTSFTLATAFEDRWAAVEGQRVVAFEEAPLIQNGAPELMEASLPGASAPRAVGVSDGVPCDAEQPRPQSRWILELVDTLDRAQKDLLHHVVRIRRRKPAPNETSDLLLVVT